jgi:hypothetical protein
MHTVAFFRSQRPMALKAQTESGVDLPHPTDRGRLAKERRRQRPAVAKVISLVGQVLRANE